MSLRPQFLEVRIRVFIPTTPYVKRREEGGPGRWRTFRWPFSRPNQESRIEEEQDDTVHGTRCAAQAICDTHLLSNYPATQPGLDSWEMWLNYVVKVAKLLITIRNIRRPLQSIGTFHYTQVCVHNMAPSPPLAVAVTCRWPPSELNSMY